MFWSKWLSQLHKYIIYKKCAKILMRVPFNRFIHSACTFCLAINWLMNWKGGIQFREDIHSERCSIKTNDSSNVLNLHLHFIHAFRLCEFKISIRFETKFLATSFGFRFATTMWTTNIILLVLKVTFRNGFVWTSAYCELSVMKINYESIAANFFVEKQIKIKKMCEIMFWIRFHYRKEYSFLFYCFRSVFFLNLFVYCTGFVLTRSFSTHFCIGFWLNSWYSSSKYNL